MALNNPALAGSTTYPAGIAAPGLRFPAAMDLPPAAPVLSANKVMRELHVGGLPAGVSGQQLQVCVVPLSFLVAEDG